MSTCNDLLLTELIAELRDQHKCHTVLLYGSRARGDATPTSDYDLMGIRRAGKKYRAVEKRRGWYVDIFVFPERALRQVGEEQLYMHGARILYQAGIFGTRFLARLNAAEKKKYKPLPADEINARRFWLHKMCERVSRGDIEGNYRRSWLHEALLSDYFAIRKKRYWGSRRSFAWLRRYDAKTYQLFDDVLKYPLDLVLLRQLVERVSKLKLDDVNS